MRLIGFLGAAAFVMAACGGATDPLNGGGGGTSTVTGTAGGQTVANTDTVGLAGTSVQNGATFAYAGVAMTNVPGTCAVVQRHGNPRSAISLALIIIEPGTAVSPGTYAIGGSSAGTVEASFSSEDANCQSVVSKNANAGTIVLDTVTSTLVTGSFDLTFSGTDHVTGNFSAPVCNVALFTNTQTSACGS
jgi:hypothetical protein